MAYMCVHDARNSPHHGTDAAAVCVHGFFSDVHAARERVVQLAAQQPDVQSYIIDDCNRWLCVQEPVSGNSVLFGVPDTM